ncbi:hypothetical protein [Robbsia andropogonis]|nr:hypothetical protein [Robbsia andropogonis]MCP1118377.1 hypothetical protein [Robbsia andropogonis]MCP1127844.1 hypothetical protein [Robbsia andropogonis]
MPSAYPPATVTVDQLQRGDILLYIDEPETTTAAHLLIHIAQLPQQLARWRTRHGNSRIVHALLWTRLSDGAHDVTEMSGGDVLRIRNARLDAGFYRVYRMIDNHDMAHTAATVAAAWGAEGNVPYSKRGAATSVVRSSHYGSMARAETEKHAADAFVSHPAWASEGAFCSQLVIAAYQAAASMCEVKPKRVLNLHAAATSPVTLHRGLKKSEHFHECGYLRHVA